MIDTITEYMQKIHPPIHRPTATLLTPRSSNTTTGSPYHNIMKHFLDKTLHSSLHCKLIIHSGDNDCNKNLNRWMCISIVGVGSSVYKLYNGVSRVFSIPPMFASLRNDR